MFAPEIVKAVVITPLIVTDITLLASWEDVIDVKGNDIVVPFPVKVCVATLAPDVVGNVKHLSGAT